MKPLLLFWLLFLTLFSLTKQEQSMPVRTTNCMFNYRWTNNNFNFLYCNNVTHQIYTWKLCLQQCCPSQASSYTNQPSYNVLLQCQEQQNDYGGLVVILASSLAAIVVIGIISCCVIVCCKMRRLSNQVVHDDENEEVEWEQEKDVNSKNNKMQTIVWSSQASPYRPLPLLEDASCAICLQDNTTAELYCGHQFHPKCIGSWLGKSKMCPCCRMANVRGIKVFCQECRWRYYVCTRALLKVAGKECVRRCGKCEDVQELQVEGSSGMVLEFEQSHEALQRTI